MATNAQIETVSTGTDKAKLAGAAVLLVGGVAAYYLLGKQDLWLRVLALLVLRLNMLLLMLLLVLWLNMLLLMLLLVLWLNMLLLMLFMLVLLMLGLNVLLMILIMLILLMLVMLMVLLALLVLWLNMRRKDPLSRAFRRLYQHQGNGVGLEEHILASWKAEAHDAPTRSAIGDFSGALNLRHWLAHGRYYEPRLGHDYSPLDIYSMVVDLLSSLGILLQPQTVEGK